MSHSRYLEIADSALASSVRVGDRRPVRRRAELDCDVLHVRERSGALCVADAGEGAPDVHVCDL